MVNNSKVLTVSYGTFACTLEGFDDSFDTMKAIAEYFRDLAADDRYFGAEPPTPDADMLARIAEKEIARRVAAREDEGKIVLTAAQPEAAPAIEKAPEPEAEPVAEQPPAPVVETAPEPQPEPDLTALDLDVEDTAPEPVAEAIIEEASEEKVADDATLEAVEEALDLAIDIPTDTVEEAPAREAAAEPEQQPEPQPEPEVAEAEIIEPAPEPEPEPQPEDEDQDSIAAKLQRIRDVVSKSEAQMAPDVYNEDEHADPFLAGVAKDIEAALDVDDLNDGAQEQKIPVAATDQIEAEDAQAAETPVEADAPAEASPRVRARVIRMKRADFNASVASGIIEEDTVEPAPQVEDTPVAETIESSLSAEEEAELLAELAEVEAELEGLQPNEEPAVDADSFMDIDDLGMDEPEAVAEVQPEPQPEPVQETLPEPEAAQVEAQPEEERITLRRRQLPEETDTEMSRLLDQTNTRMDEPESSRRRSAIAHLRAAVAATRAENKAEDEASEFDLAEPQRVAPARPRRTAPDVEPRKARAATPLKLVASQRVDIEDDVAEVAEQADPRPVRPRRITSDSIADAPAPGSRQAQFRAFADERGVKTMGELVEAAATYLYFELGWKGFSRQHILKMCRDAHDDLFDREDGLRSFGELLRAGKIEKGDNGRFTASERIGFRDQSDRQAG